MSDKQYDCCILPVTEETFGLAVIVFFLSLFCIVASIANLFLIGMNVAFGYELTQNETNQIITSELCYAGIDTGECNIMYGGIDTPFGESWK